MTGLFPFAQQARVAWACIRAGSAVLREAPACEAPARGEQEPCSFRRSGPGGDLSKLMSSTNMMAAAVSNVQHVVHKAMNPRQREPCGKHVYGRS